MLRKFLAIIVLGFLLLVLLLYCFGPKVGTKTGNTNPENTTFNNKAVDTAVSLLKEGYIVLRMGQGADSYMLSQLNQKDKTYSHCGIVMMEEGYPFVYHSIGGEDTPDEVLRRDSACFFFSPRHNLALAVVQLDYPTECISKLKNIVSDYYNKKPKFDLKFDLKTDDKLYCAEFVYKAINQATCDTGYIKTTTLMGCTFVGIDNLFINSHANIIWQTKFK